MRMRRAWALPALVVSAMLVGTASRAGDGPESGVPVGDFVVPFDVLDVTGPNAGTELCYR